MRYDNQRRPSGLTVNGIPSVDEIIALGRIDVDVACALSVWKEGSITFDEALRLALFRLVHTKGAFAEQASKLQMMQVPTLILKSPPLSP